MTYWDQLGWKDTFAQPAYTALQWDYAHAAGRGNVFTPQMIVNGRGVLVGSNRGQVDAAIGKFDRGNGGPVIVRSGNRITIASGTAIRPATVWLVRYDPRVQNVPIRAGENGGRTLPHRDVVRTLQPLGTWAGTSLSLREPLGGDPAWRSAVLIQQGKGGPIIAAARL